MAFSTPQFQGIVGLSWFNPEQKFSGLSEGGLLVIFSGELRESVIAQNVSEDSISSTESSSLCWMHRFKLSEVIVEGVNLTASAGGVVLEFKEFQKPLNADLETKSSCKSISVEISYEKSFKVQLEMVSKSLPIPPLGEFCFESHPRGLRGRTHWIVNNSMPVCNATVKFSADANFLQKIENGFFGSESFLSSLEGARVFAQRCENRLSKPKKNLAFESAGTGYKEHSYGLCPMPLFGWDFSFSTGTVQNHCGFVMQLYKGSKKLRALDFVFQKNGFMHHIHFNHQEFSCTWEKDFFQENIRKSVPLQRRMIAKNEIYSAECVVNVAKRIPFLREKSFFVKHFFIAEELSSCDWILKKNDTGELIASACGVTCGGETAQSRWWFPIAGSSWNHDSMGTTRSFNLSNTSSGETVFMHS